jgi:hypothetical protein
MAQEDKADFRQLGHDLRNHLFTIGMGLQTLEVDGRPERLAEILGKIRTELAAAERIADAIQEAAPDLPEL